MNYYRYKLKRNKKKYILVPIIILFLLVLFAFSGYAVAIGKDSHQVIEIMVEPGDTLWRLAQKYYPEAKDTRKTIYQIKKVNNISGYIYPGQLLKLKLEKQII